MARDILGEFGPESRQPQAARATSGGVTQARDVHNYKPPQGPTSIGNPKSPGLHGDNHGHGQQCTPSRSSGSPGIGGHNHGTRGSQR